MTCCRAGIDAWPEECPWRMHHVADCVSSASLQAPTLSADDDYPPWLLVTASGWHSTAIMLAMEMP